MLHFGPRPLLAKLRPMVWAFIPYRIDDARLVAESYETAQTKAELAEAFLALGLAWVWQPVTLNELPNLMGQLLECRKKRDVLVFNFCDGAGTDGYPGVSVTDALEKVGVPFTGARSSYYRISTSKVAMKERFIRAGVPTAPFELLPPCGPVQGVCERLGGPVMVKPDVSAASFGIGLQSVVANDAQLAAQRDRLRFGPDALFFADVPIFAERFIEGPEFTALVLGDTNGAVPLVCLPPVERVFHSKIPAQERFLSFDRYWGYFREESQPQLGEPFYRYELASANIATNLTTLALNAYRTVDGSGYGRVDMRFNAHTDQLQVLEVNANCGLSSDRETTAGEILRLAEVAFPELLAVIAEGALARWRLQAGEI
jgi:D-alanine-D-alanine ligase